MIMGQMKNMTGLIIFSERYAEYRKLLSKRYPNAVINDDFVENHIPELQEIIDNEREKNEKQYHKLQLVQN